jgi:hypothetical protein
MKNIQSIIVVCLFAFFAFAIGSCCKSKNSTGTSSADIIKFNLPIGDTGNLPEFAGVPFEFPELDSLFSVTVATYADSLMKKNNTTPAKIISIMCNSMLITSYKPGQKINFVKSIKLFMANKDGSNKKLVGTKYNISPTDSAIELNIEPNAELKSFILADSFKMILGGQYRPNSPILAGNALNFLANFSCEANP